MKRTNRSSNSRTLIEALESRQFLSASPWAAIVANMFAALHVQPLSAIVNHTTTTPGSNANAGSSSGGCVTINGAGGTLTGVPPLNTIPVIQNTLPITSGTLSIGGATTVNGNGLILKNGSITLNPVNPIVAPLNTLNIFVNLSGGTLTLANGLSLNLSGILTVSPNAH